MKPDTDNIYEEGKNCNSVKVVWKETSKGESKVARGNTYEEDEHFITVYNETDTDWIKINKKNIISVIVK